MKSALALTLAASLWAVAQASAVAETAERIVAGLKYRITQSEPDELVQAVRVRRVTGEVMVRYTNGRTAWVDAAELTAYRQAIATDSGSYLFVVAALACLMDTDRCGLEPAGKRTGTPASAAAE